MHPSQHQHSLVPSVFFSFLDPLSPWHHPTSILNPNLGRAFRNCLGQRETFALCGAHGCVWSVGGCGMWVKSGIIY